MFDLLELDYEIRRKRDSRNLKRKLYKSKKVPLFFRFSKQFGALKLYGIPKKNDILIGLITLLLVLSSILVVFGPIITDFMEYSNELAEQKIASRKYKNQTAFNFLMNTGKKRLVDGRINEAYKEFRLAYAIYPENKEVNTLIIETLSILCEREAKYCLELDKFLSINI
ncbi:hypothetical protein N1F78_14815 [Seonamhaeicola sp. MEBiC1930]|uniref:hypothetical protein n=1 Tax=Seonamhaeicola sp. MEBiC01930 TaxID=2976768 RepID=UPI003244B746